MFEEEKVREQKNQEQKDQEDNVREDKNQEDKDQEERLSNEIQILQGAINKEVREGIQEGLQQVFTVFNKDIAESNDKLDKMLKETKKKINKPMNMNKGTTIEIFNADGLTEEEKRIRRDLIIKIPNYIDCLVDNEIIEGICGSNPRSFKHSLYGKDIKTLTVIYEEIQIGLNSSKDYEQFMNMFST